MDARRLANEGLHSLFDNVGEHFFQLGQRFFQGWFLACGWFAVGNVNVIIVGDLVDRDDVWAHRDRMRVGFHHHAGYTRTTKLKLFGMLVDLFGRSDIFTRAIQHFGNLAVAIDFQAFAFDGHFDLRADIAEAAMRFE